jgi:acyl carrier protein
VTGRHPHIHPSIDESVYAAVGAALGASGDEVTRDAKLFADLGADWIDLMDILLRVERSSGVRVDGRALSAHLEGAPGAGYLGLTELKNLQRLLPQIEVRALRGRLRANHLMTRFTVGDLADLVAQNAHALAA